MIEIINILVKYLWITDFITLSIFAGIAFRKKENSSSFMTQGFIVVIISGVIIKYQELVNSFIDPSTNDNVANLWLGGFAFYDAVIIFILVAFYKSYVVNHQKVMKLAFTGLASLLMLNFIAVQYMPFLFDVEAVPYKLWIIMAFFFGVALFDGFAVFAIYKLHVFFNLPHGLIARMYILAFSVAALIQITGFCAKYFWHSKAFDYPYQIILASINIGTSFIAMLVAFLAVYQLVNNKNREGWVWKI